MSGMRTGQTWRIARISGVDIVIRPSLLLIAILLIALFETRFELWARGNAYVLGALLVLFLYVSILAHELAHMWVARALGYQVHSITLHFFGGQTDVAGEPRRPWHEFAIAVCGPLTSLGAAAVFYGAARTFDGDIALVAALVAWMNVLLAVVNLLPGLPLDGGRVLRAPLWALLADRTKATIVTGWIGRILAAALVAGAVLAGFATAAVSIIDVAIAGAVGLFLWAGASSAMAIARLQSKVSGLTAGSLAESARDDLSLPSLPAGLGGTDLLRAVAEYQAPLYRVVDADGAFMGIVSAAAINAAF